MKAALTRILAAVAVSFVILEASTAAVADFESAPEPDVVIQSPATTIPSDIAAFSGRWVGRWANGVPTILTVKMIHPARRGGGHKVEVVYSHGVVSLGQPFFRELDGDISGGALEITVNGPSGALISVTYRRSGEGLEAWYTSTTGLRMAGALQQASR